MISLLVIHQNNPQKKNEVLLFQIPQDKNIKQDYSFKI